MAVRIQLRRDTAANWTSSNPVLRAGEIGIETDTLKIKVGNGTSTWTQITTYANVTPSGLSSSLGSYILSADQGNPGGPAELDSNGDLVVPENSVILWNDDAYTYSTTLTATEPTANRTITFKNADGTVAFTSDIPSSTDTLSEGSTNKYFTDERAQDAISTALAAGTHTNITVTYNDEANSISLAAAPGYVDEQAVDAVAAALAAGTHTNITVGYNDNANSISLTGAVTYTDENAQDAVGNAVGTGLSYNDTTGAISVDTSTIQARVTDVSDTEIGYLNGVTSAIQTQLDNKLALAGGTLTGALTLHADPGSALHAATKQYVDNTASGIVAKPQVLGATTANIDATYNNGTLGVGATLTHNTNGVFPAQSGGAEGWAVGKGILVKNQTNKAHNGRYYVSDMGSPSTPYVLTRCAYCDEASEIPGAYIFVQDGTNAGTGWVQTVADATTFTVGTDDINVYQFSGSGTITAGTGITVSGNEVSINTAATVDLSTAQTLTNKTINANANTITVTSTNVSDFNEAAQDAIGNAVGAGITYTDSTGAISVDTTTIQARVADVSDTEIGYLNGVTSAIQTQLDAKVDESIITAKGDLYVGSASATLDNLAVGSNGYLLTADSAEPLGVKWAAAPVSLPSQTGNSGEYLTTDGTTASWAAIPVTSAATTSARGTVYGSTGAYQTILGYEALGGGTFSGAFSTVVMGYQAGYNLGAGEKNVIVGGFAGTANSSGSYNTILGTESAKNTSGGSNNVLLGYQSGYDLSNGSNNILIGSGAQASTSTTSNEVSLGNSSITRFKVPGVGLDIGKTYTLSSNTATTIDETEFGTWSSIEYLVSLKQGSKVRTSKVILQTDTTDVDMTEYAITETGGTISGVSITAALGGIGTAGALKLTVTDAATTNVTVKLSKVVL